MTLHPREEVLSWTPETEADRRIVQQELSAILASSHFRNSKRYPALLRYVVEKSLDGQADQLKERTLGVEVFDRRPDYDTNADPVVRFSASEVRKRIAQYYHESGTEPAIQIELPLGSYAPEFRLRFESTEQLALEALEKLDAEPIPAIHEVEPGQPALPVTINPVLSPKISSTPYPIPRKLTLSVGAALILFSLAGAFIYRGVRSKPLEQLWGPVVQTPGPVLIVVGSANLELNTPEPPLTSLYDHMVGPYHHVSLSTAVGLARLVTILERHSKTYAVKEASSTSLTDLRARNVILIGGKNNAWTLRLSQSLRFHFSQGPQARIEDRANPGNKEWAVDVNSPFTSVSSDYAIVARYRDQSTNGSVLIIAGLGPYGTEAASEFVASPQYLEQIKRNSPSALNQKNLEFVVRTDVIAGEPGPPYLVATTTF